MVAIRVRRKIEDILGHFSANHYYLIMKSRRLGAQHLNQGLNAPRSVQVHRDLDERGHDGLDKLLERGHRAHLDQLLAQVVPKLVHHDLWEYFEHDMDQAGGENFAILHLVLLELSLDHSAASLIVGHQFNLMHNIQLFERQLGLHLLGKLEERPRGSDTLFILSGVESGVVLTGRRGAIAASSVGSCAELGTHRFGSVHARAGVGRLQVRAAVGCDHWLLSLLLSRLLLRWL